MENGKLGHTQGWKKAEQEKIKRNLKSWCSLTFHTHTDILPPTVQCS